MESIVPHALSNLILGNKGRVPGWLLIQTDRKGHGADNLTDALLKNCCHGGKSDLQLSFFFY